MKVIKLFTCGLYLLLFITLIVFTRHAFAIKSEEAVAPGVSQSNCAWPFPFLPSNEGKGGVPAFEQLLTSFVQNRCYLSWAQDKDFRDTGLYVGGTFDKGKFTGGNTYGTHKAVKVYYSPDVAEWLRGGRRGELKDGATIIKEMYDEPANQNKKEDNSNLAIMIKDKNGAWDGWFWSDGGTLNIPQSKDDINNYPNAGFGLYCVNCHASAEKETLTFSALRNILGDPITFNPTMLPNQVSPRSARARRTTAAAPAESEEQEAEPNIHERLSAREQKEESKSPTRLTRMAAAEATRDAAIPRSAFRYFIPPGNLPPSIPKDMQMEWFDNVPQGPQPKGQRGFITSSQCIGCHDATQSNAAQPNMIYTQLYPPNTTNPQIDVNLSPYGEWRASMMGLSGRDPVFYAQLDSERALHPELSALIDNKCLSCHGVMGQRQFEMDKKGLFKHEYVDAIPPSPFAQYGALARDGVSCAVCHRISAEGLGTPATYTGRFKLGKPDEIFGPFEDVITQPMKNSLGLTPRKTKEDQIKTSALCGSCHTVILPVLKVGETYKDDPLEHPPKTEHEQATYLEWKNSIYNNEDSRNNATQRTCQSCHMQNQYAGNQLQFKIANIEDETFPAVDHRLPDADLHLKIRGGDDPQLPYSRHTLLGINIFTLEIFSQFSDSLGIRTVDPMDYWGTPPPWLVLAKQSALELAQKETAKVEIVSLRREADKLLAQVRVTNLAGHKLPSGVSFRRAFIELRVRAGDRTLWVSGATNPAGIIGTYSKEIFTPLPTEFFENNQFQPHYERITSEDQVQIFEELFKDSNGNFTTSFLSLDHEVKDNRLMPKGWSETGPDHEITEPVYVDKAKNPGYFDGSGSATVLYEIPFKTRTTQPISVTATLYYQSIPPYYLKQRFTGSREPATLTLQYYVQNLKTDHIDPQWTNMLNVAPIRDWKLMVTSVSKNVR